MVLYNYLIGDIGGTNIRLQLIEFEKKSPAPTILKETFYKAHDYTSLDHVIEHFLSGIDETKYPSSASIGFAGAVINNSVTVTNINHWPTKIIGDEVASKFKLKKFTIYNDFEVASYAILGLKDEQIVQINDATKQANKIISVCGPGTGLGVSKIVPVKIFGLNEYIYQVWPGEGGHITFPITTKEHEDFYHYLKPFFPQFEDIPLEYGFAGPAIPYMYNFWRSQKQDWELNLEQSLGADKFQLVNKTHFPSKEILEWGCQGKDALCQKVVDFYLSIYENVIGNIALSNLSYSGIYLIGSISISLTQYILSKKETFMHSYKNSRKYLKEQLAMIPVYVVQEPNIGLIGAFIVSQINCDQ